MKVLEISCFVPYKYSGFRVDNFLSIFFPAFTRVFYKNLIFNGFFYINSNKCFFINTVLNYGDKLSIFYYKHINVSYNYINLNITYMDDSIVIINKNYNFLMFPAKKYSVELFFYNLLNININLCVLPRFGIIHRLDKNTSGLFIMAYNLNAYYYLIKQFKSRKIKRIYEAIVFGVSSCSKKINISLRGSGHKILPFIDGRQAITFFNILSIFKDFMYLKINLFTGRKHQIRSHMSCIGHNIVGDSLYSSKINSLDKRFEFINNFSRQALHAKELKFFHPTSNKKFICFARLPNDINYLLYNLIKFN